MRIPLLAGAAMLVALPAFAQAQSSAQPQSGDPQSVGDPNGGGVSGVQSPQNMSGQNREKAKGYDNSQLAENRQAQNNQAENGQSQSDQADNTNQSYAEKNIPADRENGANVNGEPPSPADAASPNH